MTDTPSEEPVTTANLLRHIAEDWQALQTWLATQSEAQLTQTTDAQGWTVKDHLVHLSLWEESMLAILNGQSQREAMGVDEQTWAQGEDAINGVNQKRYQTRSLTEVRQMLQHSHDRLAAKIASMTDADLQRPYRDFVPTSEQSAPIFGWIVGNTFMHIREHQPWMAAIATQN